MLAVRMTRHVNGAVPPWAWADVPLRWHAAVMLDMDITQSLATPPTTGKEGGGE